MHGFLFYRLMNCQERIYACFSLRPKEKSCDQAISGYTFSQVYENLLVFETPDAAYV